MDKFAVCLLTCQMPFEREAKSFGALGMSGLWAVRDAFMREGQRQSASLDVKWGFDAYAAYGLWHDSFRDNIFVCKSDRAFPVRSLFYVCVSALFGHSR